MSKIVSVMFVSFLLCVSMTFCTNAEKLTEVKIQIESPQQNAEVGMQEIVKGKTSNTKAKIYVLVHPLLTNMWWVQRIPSPPNQDGSWQTVCYFGTENKGVGESFEVIALVTASRLEEGQTIDQLPEDAFRSDIVAVRRIR